jgi:hypothetical protein
MTFTNLTTYQFGCQKFLNASENPELKTFMLENIIGKIVFLTNIAMTEFFKDQNLFNFGANIIANCTIDTTKDAVPSDAPGSKHHGLKLHVFESLFPMLTSIKKSPTKRMKISEGVKNLMFNYHNHNKEIKDFEVIMHIGKAIMEANIDMVADVLEEGTKLHAKWMEVYENRKDVEVDLGECRDALNHCLMD